MYKWWILHFVLAIPLFAQTPITIEPNVGSSTGGDLVTIRGSLIRSCTVPLCPPPEVLIGGKPARPIIGTNFFITPPHEPGTYAITTRGFIGTPELPNAFTYVNPLAAPRSNYERVLIPLALGTDVLPGSRGSRWTTELWARNENSFDGEILVMDGSPQAQRLTARTNTRLDRIGAQTFGVIAWVQRGIADQTSFSLRVRDLSRASTDRGTEIPVVREREMTNRVFSLLNVPIDRASRAALRVYAIGEDFSIFVRVLTMDDDRQLLEKRIRPVSTSEEAYARYFAIDDLRAEVDVPAGTPVRIEVAPELFARSVVWGFVSITDNETQHVTLVTPQR